MSTTEKTISSLISRQLPDFVRSDHQTFQRFIEIYYEWLENSSEGNTVYHIMNSEKYRDIDETIDPFIAIFKEEFLPYFPEKTSLDITKILKQAREFYLQKGSEDSVKWLFRVLFDQEVELFYPKKQILKASDGKWKLPLAFRIQLTTETEDIDPNLLEKLKGEGSESTATCVIESANKTIDKNFGTEILEIYVSNVFKDFVNGEFLVIRGVEGYTEENPFKAKIIGSISGIKIDSNITTDPQQKRRGLLYRVGDPVVVYGGLDNTAEARDAVAYVSDVSQGSIEGINLTFPGYGYQPFYNTQITVISSPGDDPNSNASTDLRVTSIDVSNVAGNSQATFREVISVDRMPIDYVSGVQIGNANYELLTSNNRNALIQVTSSTAWKQGDLVYANGNSYLTANFRGTILSSNSGSSTQFIVFRIANTVPLTTTGFLNGQTLVLANSLIGLTGTTVLNQEVPANANSQIIQTLNFQNIETGGLQLVSVLNGGYGFYNTPQIAIGTFHDTYLSEAQILGSDYTDPDYILAKQNIQAFGKISHVYINFPGSGYANGDSVIVTGRGYGFTGNVVNNSLGQITSINIINRGEGYYTDKTASVVSATGSGAILQAYEFSEGAEYAIETSAIGRVKSIALSNRGYDYISAPLVSLKVMDVVINAISNEDRIYVAEGNFIYQGILSEKTFYGIIKKYDATTNVLRVFNYSGIFDEYSTVYVGDTTTNEESETTVETTLPLTLSVDLTKTVPTPSQYPAGSVLSNPTFYGNGRAKAIAEFFNGLIKFNGFFLNTDGFISADKKIQDEKLYHNFSYIIQSEKSINQYKNILKDIVHPIGTSMFSRTISYNQERDAIKPASFVYTLGDIPTSSNVQIQNSSGNTVNGNATTFSSTLIGNLINIIDTTYPLRSRSKIVTHVDTTTGLRVEGDFNYTGEGKLKFDNQFEDLSGTVVSIGGRANLQQGLVTVYGSARRVDSANTTITGKANVDTISSIVQGIGTSFTTDLANGDLIIINGDIRVVTNNTYAANQISVNSAYSSNVNSASIYKLSANLFNYAVNDFIIVNEEERKVTQVVSQARIIVESPFSEKRTRVVHYKANTDPNTCRVTRTSGFAFTNNVFIDQIISVNNEPKRILQVTSASSLLVNSPFTYSSTAQTLSRISNTNITFYSNTNSISDYIAPGDKITFNVRPNYSEYAILRNTTGSVLGWNVAAGSNVVYRGSVFTPSIQVKIGDKIAINNEFRTVISTNTDALVVNSAFTFTGNGVIALRETGPFTANIISVSGNTILTNLQRVSSNVIGLNYFILPTYNTRNYLYSTISLSG